MVSHPRHYRWSSYRVNAKRKQSELNTPNEQYLRLGHTDDLPGDAYHGLFKAYLDEEVLDDIRASTNGNYLPGNERFKDEVSGIMKGGLCLVKQADRRSLINRGLPL